MSDVVLRNIDLMNHLTQRRGGQSLPASMEGVSQVASIIWDDFQLPQFTPTRLRQQSIPKCVSITIQVSYIFTAVAAGSPWPLVTIRDGSVASNNPLTVVNGFEMIPGDLLSFESEEKEIEKGVFLDPTQFWAFLNAVLQVRLHVAYGVVR